MKAAPDFSIATARRFLASGACGPAGCALVRKQKLIFCR